MNETVTCNAEPFSAAPNTEQPDQAPAPDVSEAAMTRLRSPFETTLGARTDRDSRNQRR